MGMNFSSRLILICKCSRRRSRVFHSAAAGEGMMDLEEVKYIFTFNIRDSLHLGNWSSNLAMYELRYMVLGRCNGVQRIYRSHLENGITKLAEIHMELR